MNAIGALSAFFSVLGAGTERGVINTGFDVRHVANSFYYCTCLCERPLRPTSLQFSSLFYQVQMRDLFVEDDGLDELRGEVHLWRLTRHG